MLVPVRRPTSGTYGPPAFTTIVAVASRSRPPATSRRLTRQPSVACDAASTSTRLAMTAPWRVDCSAISETNRASLSTSKKSEYSIPPRTIEVSTAGSRRSMVAADRCRGGWVASLPSPQYATAPSEANHGGNGAPWSRAARNRVSSSRVGNAFASRFRESHRPATSLRSRLSRYLKPPHTMQEDSWLVPEAKSCRSTRATRRPWDARARAETAPFIPPPTTRASNTPPSRVSSASTRRSGGRSTGLL